MSDTQRVYVICWSVEWGCGDVTWLSYIHTVYWDVYFHPERLNMTLPIWFVLLFKYIVCLIYSGSKITFIIYLKISQSIRYPNGKVRIFFIDDHGLTENPCISSSG